MAASRKSYLVWTLFIAGSLALGGVGGLLVSSAINESRSTKIQAKRQRLQSAILLTMQSLKVGDTLLDHTFETLNLKNVALSELIDGTTLISIMDPDCHSCLEELATVSSIAGGDFLRDRLVLISEANPRLLAEVRDSLDLPSPILYDHRGQWIQHYRVTSFPFNLIVDSDLVIRQIVATQLTEEEVTELTAAERTP